MTRKGCTMSCGATLRKLNIYELEKTLSDLKNMLRNLYKSND